LLRLEGRYYNLKSEVKSLEARRESLIRIMLDYDNQVKALGQSFDNYCQLCLQEELKLTNLQKERLKIETLVTQFQEKDTEYLRIKNIVKKEVYSALSNVAIMLKLAVVSVIQSIKRNPVKYASLVNSKLQHIVFF
jgi:maltodextrin utilization protein YvdJ